MCVCVCVSAVRACALSHREPYVFECMRVCWYRLCIESQSTVFVCAGIDCALSHSQLCVCEYMCCYRLSTETQVCVCVDIGYGLSHIEPSVCVCVSVCRYGRFIESQGAMCVCVSVLV